jgi:hypothetical protein
MTGSLDTTAAALGMTALENKKAESNIRLGFSKYYPADAV